MIERCGGTNLPFCEAGWFRGGVGIEGRAGKVASTGPESRAAEFVRVGFAGDRVGPWAFRCASTGEPRHGMIETSPKKVYGADLAYKSRSEFPQDLVDPRQNAPELMHCFRIVGCMNLIFLKWNQLGNLARRRPDLYSHTEIGECGHKLFVEVSDTLGLERE